MEQWQGFEEEAEGVVCLDAHLDFLMRPPCFRPVFSSGSMCGAAWPVFQRFRQTHQRGPMHPQGHRSWQLAFGSVVRVSWPSSADSGPLRFL